MSFFCDGIYLLVVSGPNFINVVFATQFSLMLLDLSCRDTRQMSAKKIEFYYSGHTGFTSSVQKWLNHEWKKTCHADVDSFVETTFPFIVPLGEFILKSNDFLTSNNC